MTAGRCAYHSDAPSWWNSDPRGSSDADLDALKIGRYTERYILHTCADMFSIINHLQEDLSNLSRSCGGQIPHLVGGGPIVRSCDAVLQLARLARLRRRAVALPADLLENLAAAKLGIAPGWKTSELLDGLGVTENPDTKHTALGDVETAVAAYAATYGLEVI
jgi:hypothetical protein